MTTTDLIIDRDATLLGDATATFSPCRTYRYALTRTWDTNRPVVVWVMLNPSTADAFTDDPTIRRTIGFTKRWGAGGIVIHNLFGLRSTDPRALADHPDPVGPDNDVVIAHTLSVNGPLVARVMAAWGAYTGVGRRAERVLRMVEARHSRTVCLGTTKDGHPRHPLYVAGDTATVPFRSPT